MTEKIKVIIADDHDLFRDGLLGLLESDGNIEVLAEASNAPQLIQQVNQYTPDVIITDLIMPGDGVKAIKEICSEGISRIIALSSFESESLIVEALEAGALGFIQKNSQRGEIIEAIKNVYNFKPYYCQSTSSKVAKRISGSKFNPYSKMIPDLFSAKELEIICLVCEEKSSKEIAKIVLTSERTVERMRAVILSKMNVKTVAGVVIYAVKNYIYSIGSKDQEL
jgi:DNA-binding NarL/FixJ family response regulator